MTARETLDAALDGLRRAGRTWPCRGRDEWITDDLDPDKLAELAEACAQCPVLAECRAAALEARASGGVWAGEQLTGNLSRRKAALARLQAAHEPHTPTDRRETA